MLKGILVVSQGVSRVNGTILAICGRPDAIAAATNFLAGKGLGHGMHISVTGGSGLIGNTAVFCMADASRAVGIPAPPPPPGISEVAQASPTAPTADKRKPAPRKAKKAKKAKTAPRDNKRRR